MCIRDRSVSGGTTVAGERLNKLRSSLADGKSSGAEYYSNPFRGERTSWEQAPSHVGQIADLHLKIEICQAGQIYS